MLFVLLVLWLVFAAFSLPALPRARRGVAFRHQPRVFPHHKAILSLE
jgi:hypothetical protein